MIDIKILSLEHLLYEKVRKSTSLLLEIIAKSKTPVTQARSEGQ